MDDPKHTRDPETGAEGDGSDEKDTLPAAPEPDSDSPMGDTDQHSKVPTPPAERMQDPPA